MARILAAPGDAPTSRRERPARAESVVVPPRARAAATAASALRALHALGPARRAALGLAVAALLLAVVLVVRHETGRPAVATAAALPPGQTFTLAWGGDFTPGSAYGRPPDRARGMLGAVAGRLRRADVAALNLEGTFGRGGPEKCAPGQSPTCFAFQAPARNAVALGDAGVDVVNLANNHAWDYGAAGMGQTVTAVRRHGAKVTGRPGEITLVDLPRARVAFLGFAAYRWASPIRDLPAVRGLVQRAAQQANVVVALMHAGAEGAGQSRTPDLDEEAFGEQRGNPRAFAHTAVDAGADLVLGSGPHVLRGMELYRGRLIAYSLGNLAGYRNFSLRGDSALSGLLRVRVGPRGTFAAGAFAPLVLRSPGIPARDASGAASRLVTRVGRLDFGSRAVGISSSGRLRAPRST